MRLHSTLVVISLAGALLATVAVPARSAAGLNLSWTDCGTAGQLQRNFACNTNLGGSQIMVGSAIIGHGMPQLNGQASTMILVTNQPSLSPWWHMEPGGCRAGAFSGSFDFTAGSSCFDPWQGQAAGGTDYQVGYGGSPNRARLRTVCAIAGSTSITGTDEYAFFKVGFTLAKTAGNATCSGCTDGACIVFTQLQVTQPAGVGDYTINETPITRGYVLWQDGGAGVQGGCPGATPVRAKTWGSLKSLYR